MLSPLNQNTLQHGEVQVSSDEIVVLVAHKEIPGWDVKLSAALRQRLDDLAGKGNIRLPQVLTVDKWEDVITVLGNAKPRQRVVQIFTHGQRAYPNPLGYVPAKLWIDEKTNEFADGKKFASVLKGYDCAFVTVCYSYNMIETMLEQDKSEIKHLIVCEGHLSDDELTQVAVAFYSALLCKKLTIASAFRVASEFLEQTIAPQRNATIATENDPVKLHYFQNGVKKQINEIEFEKAFSNSK